MNKQDRARRFLVVYEDSMCLWSNDYLKRRRQHYYLRWCFDTGDSVDLEMFERLDEELLKRKESAKRRKEWIETLKEDPIWCLRNEIGYLK